jgi:hypothetical protein
VCWTRVFPGLVCVGGFGGHISKSGVTAAFAAWLNWLSAQTSPLFSFAIKTWCLWLNTNPACATGSCARAILNAVFVGVGSFFPFLDRLPLGRVPEDEETFYFDSADSVETSQEARRTSGLSTAMLADAIRQMPARRIVVIIDTCQSGGAIESLSGIAETKGLLERGKKNDVMMGSSSGPAVGVYVIAATSPVESGKQSVNAANTPLVATLLEALQTRQQDSDGRIWMADVVRYIQRRFKEISGKSDPLYSPLIAISGANFPIAVVQ